MLTTPTLSRPLLPPLPDQVVLREVGPRDGLQAEEPIEPTARAELIRRLLASGITRVEAVSFVSEKAVPAMAGARAVLDDIGRPDGVTIAALVPNLKGAEMALEAGVDELTVTISASPAYNERNVKMTVDESTAVVGSVVEAATRHGIPVDAVISCAFGSPYEGDIAAEAVAKLADQLLDSGVSAITLADTTGMCTPRILAEALGAMPELHGRLGLHLHETRATGLLNLYAALAFGIDRFDTSVGGLGGSPFAANAAGNVATEEAVALLDDLGIDHGIDVERLIEAAHFVEELVGHPVPSRVAKVGPRTRLS